jgi:hypothetical protein
MLFGGTNVLFCCADVQIVGTNILLGEMVILFVGKCILFGGIGMLLGGTDETIVWQSSDEGCGKELMQTKNGELLNSLKFNNSPFFNL